MIIFKRYSIRKKYNIIFKYFSNYYNIIINKRKKEKKKEVVYKKFIVFILIYSAYIKFKIIINIIKL